MLNTPMLESAENTIEVPDFGAGVVKAMLDFIYTGHTGDLKEMAGDLMQIAEKYNLGGLKEASELTLSSNLNVKNAADVLFLADLHSASILKAKVAEFIKENAESVKKTQSFQEVVKQNPALLLDLYFSK